MILRILIIYLRLERKLWDVFGIFFEDSMLSLINECWNVCFKIIRIMFCFLFFMVVLVIFIVLKMIFLLMIVNIFFFIIENCFKILNGMLLYLLNFIDVRWIWSIFIIIIVFYFFMILKYLWVLMK